MHFNAYFPMRFTIMAAEGNGNGSNNQATAMGVDTKLSVPTTLRNLPVDNKRNFEKGESNMPRDYQVKTADVICGNRGSKETYSHSGNERFRVLIEMRLQRYSQSSRKGRSDIVKEIVGAVRDYGGHFVRQDEDNDGQWIDIGNQKAREKCGHAIRAAMTKLKIPLQHEDSLSTGSGATSTIYSAAVSRRSSAVSQLSASSASEASVAASNVASMPTVTSSEAKLPSREEPVADHTNSAYVSEFERSLLTDGYIGVLGKRDLEVEESHDDANEADESDSQFLGYERVKRRKYGPN